MQIIKPAGGPDTDDRRQPFPNKFQTCGAIKTDKSFTPMVSTADIDFKVNDAEEHTGFLVKINFPNVAETPPGRI